MCEDTTGHSCLAIRYFQEENPATSPPCHLDPPVSCHLATWIDQFLKVARHKCSKGSSKGPPYSLSLDPAHIVCVSESDKLYRQVKLWKEASGSLDQYLHKGERFSKEDKETFEGRFQTV